MAQVKKDNLELYNMIFRRRSVRKYDRAPLKEEVLDEISQYLKLLDTMYADSRIKYRLVGQEMVKTGLQPPAPHYIAVFAEKNKENLLDIGFQLEQLSLYMSARGIASCWQGIPKFKGDLKKLSNPDFVIFLAFGGSTQKLYREDKSEFSRKMMGDISEAEGVEDLLEPVRLAPSAINNQPWFFSGDRDKLHVYCNDAGIIKGFIMKKYNMIDIGIGLSHLWLAARQKGMTVEFSEEAGTKERKGYYYVLSVSLKKDENR